MKRIGVLALQGAFAQHIVMLRQLGAEAVPVRLPEELEGLDGLVIPGGESTTIGKLMHLSGFNVSQQRLLADRFPVLGTCAGMILLAKQVIGISSYSLAAIDIKVRRNAFGRQVDSFEVDLQIFHNYFLSLVD